jgi:ubiquinone biosynthesis protein
MEVQPSLVLLQKTLLNIEGLGKQLYPELDLWENALPFLENWQRKRLSPINNLKKITEKIPQWLEQLPQIPELIYESLQELKTLRSHRENQYKEKEALEARRNKARSRRYLGFGIVALAAAAISLHPRVAPMLDNMSATTLILVTAGIALLVLWRE